MDPDPHWFFGQLDPDPDWEYGSGSRREGKNDKKKLENGRNFKFLNAVCSPLRAEGFSCSLDVLFGGL